MAKRDLFFNDEYLDIPGIPEDLKAPSAILPPSMILGAVPAVKQSKSPVPRKEEHDSDESDADLQSAKAPLFKERKTKSSSARAARPKKVQSDDLDVPDEILVRMKEAKYLEREIAEHLAKKFDVDYNPKTIGTRYTRIKEKAAKAQDKLFVPGQTLWHDGDDEALQIATTFGNNKIDEGIRKLQAKKWAYIADKLKSLKPASNYSAKACEERVGALAYGIARPTAESVMNPGPMVVAQIQQRRAKEAQIAGDARVAPVCTTRVPASGAARAPTDYAPLDSPGVSPAVEMPGLLQLDADFNFSGFSHSDNLDLDFDTVLGAANLAGNSWTSHPAHF